MSVDRAVGFIGLGNMGLGMARNVLAAGYDVVAYDVAPEPLQRLVSQGARPASSPADVGRQCQGVMVMVVSGAQVEAVLSGPDGLLETMGEGGTVMVHSTIALSEIRRAAALAAACGVRLIDCPVSGGVEGAAEGQLTILCGGDDDVVQAQWPLLETVAANITHLGPLGAGLVGKLANNLILGVGRLAIGEAFAMAKHAGLSLDKLYETMITCSADSKQLRGLEGVILRGNYPATTFHGLKDLTAAVDSGRAVGQAMPVTNLAREFYQLIDTKLGGLRGSNEVMRYYLED